MPETTPLIKAALNLRGGAGFDVYDDYVLTFYLTRKRLSLRFTWMAEIRLISIRFPVVMQPF